MDNSGGVTVELDHDTNTNMTVSMAGAESGDPTALRASQ